MSNYVDVGGGRAPPLSGLAQIEAKAAHSDRVETQHHLLAMLGDYPSDASRVLSANGVTREGIQAAVSRLIAAGVSEDRHSLTANRLDSFKRTGDMPPSRQAEEILYATLEESSALGQHVLTWSHVLLGIIRIADGIAVKALRESGANVAAIRDGVLKALQSPRQRD